MESDVVERVLGCRPKAASDEGPRVESFVRNAELLADGEVFLAGADDSWLASARRGTVLTDRRVFRYRDSAASDIVALDRVSTVVVRRMWFPGAGPAGRGEVFGNGPVVILRFRFVRADGRATRLRLQSFAATLMPFARELHARFADRFHVARTLPGL